MDTIHSKTTRPKSRQSLAYPALAGNVFDKDNNTADVGLIQRQGAALSMKKSRGKSLGPGGLEALKEASGNAIKVGMSRSMIDYGVENT